MLDIKLIWRKPLCPMEYLWIRNDFWIDPDHFRECLHIHFNQKMSMNEKEIELLNPIFEDRRNECRNMFFIKKKKKKKKEKRKNERWNTFISLQHEAPAERRQVFRNELQRVGTAGAKVLREIGEKVKKMEKLGSVDILYEVHEAAEKLQKKVDRKSYLFVNAESWEIGTRATAVDVPQEFGGMDDHRYSIQHHRSRSETVIDIDSILTSKGWDNRTCNMASSNHQTAGVTPENMVEKPKMQTAHTMPKARDALNALEEEEEEEEESKTYESASALSLATFTSLLIEFVARLQNVVDSFEELSEKAKFKEPVDLSEASRRVGLCSRLIGYMKFWKRESNLLV